MLWNLLADATTAISSTPQPIDWQGLMNGLHLSPVAVDLHGIGVPIQIRWYSLAYIGGILLGWWYLITLLAQPGAPMARRHADDFVLYAVVGIMLGGRLGYALFYNPALFTHPMALLRVWEGGMSLHGGVLGVVIAILLFCRLHHLNVLRVCDYVACCIPFGLGLGRLANFINGELWGRVTSVPWAMVFPGSGDGLPRHPSQLYEFILEGPLLFAILWYAFWRTRARYEPGMLVGLCAVAYGVFRFGVETLRQPDAGLEALSWGLTMGQTLSVPLILVGIYLMATAKRRRIRVEPVSGSASVG